MMSEGPPLSRTPDRSLPLSLLFFTIAAGRLALMNCRTCREPMDLHQPNPSQPDQFLATCAVCGSWYRVELRSGENRAKVVLLPEVSEIRPTTPPSPPVG